MEGVKICNAAYLMNNSILDKKENNKEYYVPILRGYCSIRLELGKLSNRSGNVQSLLWLDESLYHFLPVLALSLAKDM